MTWAEAEAYCKRLTWDSVQGHLASVHSEEEHNFIFNRGNGKENLWLGGHDTHKEGHYVWSDGTAFSYQNWGNGEPNNGQGQWQEDCISINYNGRKWNDIPCSEKNKFVCKLTRKGTVPLPPIVLWTF